MWWNQLEPKIPPWIEIMEKKWRILFCVLLPFNTILYLLFNWGISVILNTKNTYVYLFVIKKTFRIIYCQYPTKPIIINKTRTIVSLTKAISSQSNTNFRFGRLTDQRKKHSSHDTFNCCHGERTQWTVNHSFPKILKLILILVVIFDQDWVNF